MTNNLQSLSELFQNRLFRIPDYQRGYAWQQPQLVDFWDDLNNLQEGRNHYVGLLSLKKIDDEKNTALGNDYWIVSENGFKAYHVVDGQQRLTTIVILVHEIVCFVRSIEENREKKDDEIILGAQKLDRIVEKYIGQKVPPNFLDTTYLFGYEIDNPSYEYLRYKIFDESGLGSIQETYYTKNLEAAKIFFDDNIQKLYEEKGVEGITKLYKKLTQNLQFNLHEIGDEYDVFVAFETMNNRGKKLTNLELLKNRMIYLSTLFKDEVVPEREKDVLREKVNDAWKEVYKQLGRNKSKVLSDDEYLRAHWIIYFTYSRKRGDDYIQYLLDKFSAKNVFENNTTVKVESEVKVYEEVNDDDNEDVVTETMSVESEEPQQKIGIKDISKYAESLKELASHWYDTHFPEESTDLSDEEKLWINRINMIGISYFRPLVTVALNKRKKTEKEERVELLKAIERFIFVCFRIGRYRSNYQNSVYYKAARELYHDETTLADITSALESKTKENMEYAIRAFRDDIKRKYANEGRGYYDWNSLKYFMYEYEYNLMSEKGIEKINPEKFFSSNKKDEVTIEHILPQTPTKRYWKNEFRQYINNPQEMAYLTGELGNLLPLSKSINSSLQNDSFEEKKNPPGEGRLGYKNGSHSEIEVSQKDNWNAEAIHDRTIKLLSFMETRWEIPLTDDQKKELAFDDFINDGRTIPAELPEEEPSR